MTKQSGKFSKSTSTADLARLFAGTSDKPERLAKRMAAAGLCSRRDAEKWIEAGRVSINGTLHTSPAHNISPGDDIRVDGKLLPKIEPPRLWRYYKPRGLIVSHRDEKGRESIFNALPPEMPRVVSVGRLDLDSEGLILLTTSGDLARHLELPATGWNRNYRVRVYGRINEASLDGLADGITIDGIRYQGIKASLDRQGNSNTWLSMTLKEGKNREIRRIIEYLDCRVSRLIRVSYGPFTLNTLKEGDVEEVRPAVLRDQLGLPRIEGSAKAKPAAAHAGRPKRHRKKPAEGKKHADHQRKKTRHPSQRS
jgi:23S rRNA pseudouridine2605 synthase